MGTCVPSFRFDNQNDTTEFSLSEVRKVVAMAGIQARRLADESICSSDLCLAAANRVLESLDWERNSIGALIMVTQSPDYFLPSTSCIVQERLGLSDQCAAFDVGLGCSGYPYGLWLAAMMLESGGLNRVLLLHGETPARFADKSDRSVSLLFGDAGSATALEASDTPQSDRWPFVLYTNGAGYKDMIIEAGGFRKRFCNEARKHFVEMSGTNVFNFTIKCIPPLIEETLELSGLKKEEIDYYIFHQSNQFIIKHLVKKSELQLEKVPIVLDKFGNAGGPSIPLAITKGNLIRPAEKPLKLMLLGYGVGLSWGSAIVSLEQGAQLQHIELNAC